MKTRPLTNLSLVLTLSALPFAVGCTQSSATDAEPALTNAQPTDVKPAGDNSAALAPAESADIPPAPRREPVLPPSILPATPLAEVIKLAQSGVDENVMLAFINNSIKPFDLDSEEIVYLNDIGVSGSLITTMMEHDKGLKPLPAILATSTAPEPKPAAEPAAPEPGATAPTYVDPPSATPETETAAQPTYVSNNYFYNSLAPYGNWIEVEGYGRCWQPTVVVVNPKWQPYCDRGRWVYSDAGWYWLSDYSWGATTFHYGRWFTHPSRGWCWWPDTVWAPSWVSWRYSNAYCGWAPLPPTACYQPGFGFSFNGSSVGFGFGFGLTASCYTFVPWGGFCGARPYQYRLPAYQATHVYNNSTVINNYANGNNNTVINKGISPDRVREHTRTEVRTVAIRDQPVGGSRKERIELDGRTLAVHRPSLSTLNASREALERSPVRSSSARATEASVARPPQNGVNLPVARIGREDAGMERNRFNGNSTTAPVTPSVVTRAPATSPTRFEARPSREPQQRMISGSANQSRANSPVVVRPLEASAPSTTAPASTPKVYQPRVVQGSAQNTSRPSSAAPSGSLVIIGGRSSPRSGGRDYSVYSTPSPATAASAPASSPRSVAPSQSVSSPTVNSPSATETEPALASRARTERDVLRRGPYSTLSKPSPHALSLTPRAVPDDSAPSFARTPAAPSRTPNGQRFESRSGAAPAGLTTAPDRPQPGPGSSSGQRSR